MTKRPTFECKRAAATKSFAKSVNYLPQTPCKKKVEGIRERDSKNRDGFKLELAAICCCCCCSHKLRCPEARKRNQKLILILFGATLMRDQINATHSLTPRHTKDDEDDDDAEFGSHRIGMGTIFILAVGPR